MFYGIPFGKENGCLTHLEEGGVFGGELLRFGVER